jgi:F-type H+-transporting ATPase subunit gamma
VRRYSEIVDAAVADGLLLAGAVGAPPPAEPVRHGRRLLCIIGTDHGFVGNLNARLVQDAVRPSEDEAVFVVGRRAAGVAKERRIGVAGVMPATAHVQTIPLLARRITERISAYDEVRVAFCGHRAGRGLTVVERQIVPIVRRADAPRRTSPPLHHLQPAALLHAFAGEYLMAEIARALTEAFVGESATRLRVLTEADRNIGDKIEELQRMARQLRQETITAELLDIVVGAEAVAAARR